MTYPSLHITQELDNQHGYHNISMRVKEAVHQHHRSLNDVELIAVSKLFGIEAIEPIIAQGHCNFGENYIQEAVDKFSILKPKYPQIKLHFIGALQSNKADIAVDFFDAIHSLDRPSLVKSIAKARDKYQKQPQLFIQVNSGDEAQKGGVRVADLENLLKLCQDYDLIIDGLMVIPPIDEPVNLHFALMQKLADDYHDYFDGDCQLSMGMSSDFEQAIAFGAHYIRVGTAIFGERPKKGAHK